MIAAVIWCIDDGGSWPGLASASTSTPPQPSCSHAAPGAPPARVGPLYGLGRGALDKNFVGSYGAFVHALAPPR